MRSAITRSGTRSWMAARAASPSFTRMTSCSRSMGTEARRQACRGRAHSRQRRCRNHPYHVFQVAAVRARGLAGNLVGRVLRGVRFARAGARLRRGQLVLEGCQSRGRQSQEELSVAEPEGAILSTACRNNSAPPGATRTDSASGGATVRIPLRRSSSHQDAAGFFPSGVLRKCTTPAASGPSLVSAARSRRRSGNCPGSPNTPCHAQCPSSPVQSLAAAAASSVRGCYDAGGPRLLVIDVPWMGVS